MKLKKRFTRKTNKPNPNDSFVSPLLRQDDNTADNNKKVAFNFLSPSKQVDNSNNTNDQNSSLFPEKSSEGVTLPHSLLVQPESEYQMFNFTTTTIPPAPSVARTSKSSKEMEAVIPTQDQSVLPLISAKPINELLEVPLESLKSSSKKHKKNDIIKKATFILQRESHSTTDATVSTVEVKVESDFIKSEPKMIDSGSSSESSCSGDEDVVLSKVPNIDDSVIVLDDSASEDEDIDVTETDKQEDEILLDDAEVEAMNLSQELDVRLQSKKEKILSSGKQIFVGNLPSSMKKLHIFKFFEKYGRIRDLKFIRSKVNNTIICFITYKDRKSAQSSLEANGLLYCGHNFRVAKVGRLPVVVGCTIVVTNLPEGTSTQNIYDIFEVCGPIQSHYMEKTKGKLLAYVTFELEISATYAVLINNFFLKGRQLYIHQYVNQREQQGLSNRIT